MRNRVTNVLAASLILFLISGTIVFTAVGTEALLGIDVPLLDVSGPENVTFNMSEQWAMHNSTRVLLRDDWEQRQDGNESVPDSYCLRTRREQGANQTELYDPLPQRFDNRSINGTVTESICQGTHPVVLRPTTDDACRMEGRDYWMLGHIEMDAAIIQCGPERFVLYTDDDFEGKLVPIMSAEESNTIPEGGIPVTVG